MKKAENRYIVFDTYTGETVEFVATEARAKKICDTYDTMDYREMNLLDKDLLSSKERKKAD